MSSFQAISVLGGLKLGLDRYEMMAEAQRDLTPEEAAARLRGCSEVHYMENSDQ